MKLTYRGLTYIAVSNKTATHNVSQVGHYNGSYRQIQESSAKQGSYALPLSYHCNTCLGKIAGEYSSFVAAWGK